MGEQERLRWRQFALVFTPAAAGASLLVLATVQGGHQRLLVVAGKTTKVSADETRAWGVAQFPDVVSTKAGTRTPV